MVKKLLLYFGIILIIVFSFVVPKLLLRIEDLSREKEIFAREKYKNKIDVQAEKIYLVRFIHDIFDLKEKKIYYDNNKTVAVSSSVPMTEVSENKVPSEQILNELSKIISNNIIKDIDYSTPIDYYEVKNMFSFEYTVITGDIVTEDFGLGLGIEEKTGKIISLDFPKSILRSDIDKKKQLENYAKYLDLDIIGDWKYENQVLSSEKAQLSIILDERERVCKLIIAPTGLYEEYEAQRNYEVVEKKK